MFSNLNVWEFTGLVLLALFIFGPERLPKVISDASRMLRGLRDMARNASSDLTRELGTDVNITDLNPKTFIRKHLLSEDDEATLRRPFEDIYRDTQRDVTRVTTTVNEAANPSQWTPAAAGERFYPYDPTAEPVAPTSPPEQRDGDRRYDSDAT